MVAGRAFTSTKAGTRGVLAGLLLHMGGGAGREVRSHRIGGSIVGMMGSLGEMNQIGLPLWRNPSDFPVHQGTISLESGKWLGGLAVR